MAELGQKHECPECGLKYYDLGKTDAVCPKCGDGSEPPEEKKKKVAKG